ncbi:MAG: hypothetical protein RIT25_2640 [Planctomycetota bacterium]
MNQVLHGWAMIPLAELAMGGAVLATLAADMIRPASRLAVHVALLGTLVALACCFTDHAPHASDMLVVDAMARLARPAILAATALALLAGSRDSSRHGDAGAWATMVLGTAFGSMVVACSSSLVTLWLGLEAISLSSCVLAAWRVRDRRAAEAGMKLVLFGGIASGLTLFGMSHLYGLSGQLGFGGIATALTSTVPTAAVGALLLASVGLAYKLSLVPFHFVAPDAWQGAPATSVAVFATVPKFALVAVAVRLADVLLPAGIASHAAFGTALAAVAIASLLVAALVALVQRDAKRILAFSSIGHAGSMVLALACLPDASAKAALAYYLLAYGAATLGAFTCIEWLERSRGSASLAALAGAVRTQPGVVVALCLFLFSLMGVPPLAGFLAKWSVLREAFESGLAEAGSRTVAAGALVLALTTAVSAWSYLLVVRAVLLAPAAPGAEAAPERPSAGPVAVLAACVAAVVVLGLWPDAIGLLLGLT